MFNLFKIYFNRFLDYFVDNFSRHEDPPYFTYNSKKYEVNCLKTNNLLVDLILWDEKNEEHLYHCAKGIIIPYVRAPRNLRVILHQLGEKHYAYSNFNKGEYIDITELERYINGRDYDDKIVFIETASEVEVPSDIEDDLVEDLD